MSLSDEERNAIVLYRIEKTYAALEDVEIMASLMKQY